MVVQTNLEEYNTLKHLTSYSFHNINTSLLALMFRTYNNEQDTCLKM